MNDRTQDIDLLMAAAEEIVESVEYDEEAADDSAPVPTHTLLEVWQAVLSNIEAAEKEKVEMRIAARLVGRYPQLKFQDLPKYAQSYNDRLKVMREILQREIESDPKCFTRVEDDGEANRHHYLNLLAQWQVQLQRFEAAWDPADRNSHITFAAIADVHEFVLGEKGLVAHLDAIEFEYSEEDSMAVRDAIIEQLEG